MNKPTRLVSFDDDGEPDSHGRRRFTLWWAGTDHVRLGKVRAQCFHARLEGYEPLIPLKQLPGEDEHQAAARMLGCEPSV